MKSFGEWLRNPIRMSGAAEAALAESQQPDQESGESDPFPDCTMECGGLTNWCKCRSDAAALAELEKRNV